MNEIETIARAKMYIDKLANGINPIDDMPVGESDVVNNVRISRCFFYISDVLRQIIDNGGITPPKAVKKEKFYITSEALEAYQFSETAVPVSKIAESINAFIDETYMKKVSHKNINDWLISLGLLSVVTTPDGKNTKRPTERGTELGIFTEHRIGQRGEYDVNLYNINAQRFVIDNIDALVSFMHYDKKKTTDGDTE